MNAPRSIDSTPLSSGRPTIRWRTLLATSVLLAPALLPAQVTAPDAAKPATDKSVVVEKNLKKAASEAVFELSPFEVNAEKDNGFMATNAGTATKLGIDMKDLAAPYSVMTGEFIKALGITNLEDAAVWATNGAPVLDGQGADQWQGANTRTTSSMYFARGVIMNAGQQRNFFINAGTNDTYNVERVDFGRGPNAVLFNVGSNDVLGGGISTVGKRARTDRDFTTLGFTVGSWNYYRSSLDVNRKLTDNLGVRANFLWQDRGGWQDGERDDRTGVTLAGLYRITPKTELMVEVRKDNVKRSRPPVPFGDNLSAWDGTTVFNAPIGNYQYDGKTTLVGTNQTLRTLPSGSSGQGQFEGIWRMGDSYIYDPATGTVMNWLNMASTRRGDENSWTPIYLNGQRWSRNGNNDLLPIGNWGATGGNTRWPDAQRNAGSAAFTDMINLPDDRFSRQIAGSQFTIPSPRDSLIPETPLYTENTKGVNVALTHKFADNLFFEVQADANEVQLDTVAPSSNLGFRNLFIDLNRNLPNGSANPHFLDAYGESDMGMRQRGISNYGVRAALAYMKDFGKWGHYTFNLSVMGTGRDVEYRERYLALNSASDPRDWHWSGYRVRFRYYQHDSARPGFGVSPTSLRQVTSTNPANSDTVYTSSTVAIKPTPVLTYWEDRKERNQSAVFAFAGRWFDNKLIVSPGVRFGRQKTSVRLPITSYGWGSLPNDPSWDGNTLTDAYWRPDAPTDWRTLTFTPRNNAGVALSPTPIRSLWRGRPLVAGYAGSRDLLVPSPLYGPNDRFMSDFNPLPADNTDVNTTIGATYHIKDWVALKLSYGTSFLPADVFRYEMNTDGALNDAKSEIGSAYDVALTFNLFDGKLAVTPRYYFNRKENMLRTSPIEGAVNTLILSRAWNDPYNERGNPFGYSELRQGDYISNYNDGYELEVAGNITRGWRLSASVGTARINEYDRWPLSPAYVQFRKDEFRQVLEAAGGMLDTTRKPMNGSRSVDAAPGLAIANPAITDAMIQGVVLIDGSNARTDTRTNAVNAYNNIWIQYDNIQNQVEGVGLDRLTAKLVTDYTIQEGRLKGLRYGIAAFFVDRDLAGYRGGDTIANPNFNSALPVTSSNRPWIDDPNVDYNTPIWVKRPFQIDALFGYTRRIRGFGRLDGTEVEFQLNVKNILNGSEVYYQDDGVTLRAPDGDITKPNRVAVPGRIASYQRPINYEFTTTFKF